jgi:hypothetical protein
MKNLLLKTGCIIAASIFVLFAGFIIFFIAIYGDFSGLSYSKAKTIVKSDQFKVIEAYFLENGHTDRMIYCGEREPNEKTNIWQVNDCLIDFESNEIIRIPDSVYYYTKEDLQTKYDIVTLTLDEFQAKNKAEYDSIDIKSLRTVAKNAMDFGFMSISKKNSMSHIQYKIQGNSPLNSGYGILYSSDSTIIRSGLHDEIHWLTDSYYRYKDRVQ